MKKIIMVRIRRMTYTHTVESAASAGANNNIAGVSYDLETTADYREAVGGFAEIGSANGNTLVMEGRQLDDGTNMTIDAGDYSDENLVLVPDMDVAALPIWARPMKIHWC